MSRHSSRVNLEELKNAAGGSSSRNASPSKRAASPAAANPLLQSVMNLASPATPGNPATPFTSRLRFLNDMIVSPEFLITMGKMYVGDHRMHDIDPAKDIYMSPINAPDAILSHFPPTFIQAGDKDPMIDDSIIFTARLRGLFKRRERELSDLRPTRRSKAKVAKESIQNVQLRVFEGCSHAYLQMLSILPEAREALQEIGDYLMTAFYSPKAWKPPPPGAHRGVSTPNSAGPYGNMNGNLNGNPLTFPLRPHSKRPSNNPAEADQPKNSAEPYDVPRIKSEGDLLFRKY